MAEEMNADIPESKPRILNDELRQQLAALKEDVQTLRADLRGIAGTVGARGKSRLADVKARLGETAKTVHGQAKEKFQDIYEVAREGGEQAVETCREKIVERPMTSLLVAFLGGIIVGRLLLRR